MKITSFIDRPVLSCVLSAFVVILGLIGLFRLPMEQFPGIAPPVVTVSATYTGANAETLQRSVIAPLEQAINGVEGIDYMTSSANNNGQASVKVYFRQGTDPDMAAVNVQNRIAQAQGSLPAEVVQAGVNVRKSQNSTAKILALYSPDDRYDQKFIFNYFKINIEPRLARIPGVGDITMFGSDYSLRIWMKPDRMAAYGLVPSDIETLLAEQNIEVPAGTLGADSETSFQTVLKYRGRYETEEEFRQMVLRSGDDGDVLRLGDVADVELGQLSYAVKNELNGHPGANCMIAQLPGSNANEVVSAIDDVVAQVRKDLPDGLVLTDLMSVKSFMDASISNVLRTLAEAFVLVVLTVMLFLQNLRSSLVPSITIVVSLVGTLAFLYFFGFTLNMLTLFALVLVIGTVVDDAIVVVEAVQSQFDSGETDPYTATVKGMRGIARPLITTSLVFMAVFVPVCFVEGALGIFYRQFGITMAVAVLISTFNALTLSPALCVLVMRPSRRLKSFSRTFNRAFVSLSEKYASSLPTLFRHRYVLVFLVIAFIGAFIYLLSSTKTGLVPDEDTGTVVVDVQTAPGTSRAATEELMSKIEKRIKDIPQFQVYSKSVGMGMLGGQSASCGTFIIRLKPWAERSHAGDDNKSVVAEIYRRLSDIKDARIMVFAQPVIAGYGVTNGFEVHVQDYADRPVSELESVTRSFVAALADRPEIGHVQTGFNSAYPQYMMEVDPILCKRDGVAPDEVLHTVGAYIGGSYSSDINRFSKVYRVIIQAPARERMDQRALDKIFVRTKAGDMSPASRYIKLTRVYGAESLSHFNLFQSIAVNGVPADGYSSGQAIAAVSEVAALTLPAGYGYEFGAMSREEARTGNGSIWIFVVCVLFIYLILAALYESMLVPFAVIFSIPIGMTGSFLLAWLFGLENNIYMQTGVIMLIGLLSKTAILIIEYAADCCRRGIDVATAAKMAAKHRLRPILMTSSTMIFGLLPMIFANGVGSNGSRSLAIGVIGGLVLGTLALLFITPALFIMFKKHTCPRA